jgi:hypothetical protein
MTKAAILAGLIATSNLGEEPRAFMAAVSLDHTRLHVEADWSPSAKVESGEGWVGRAGAGVRFGVLSAGAMFSHRDGGAWTKDRVWPRLGLHYGPVAAYVSAAVNSPNREVKGEVRLGGCSRGLCAEGRAFVQSHSQMDITGGPGYGAMLLIGIGGRATKPGRLPVN